MPARIQQPSQYMFMLWSIMIETKGNEQKRRPTEDGELPGTATAEQVFSIKTMKTATLSKYRIRLSYWRKDPLPSHVLYQDSSLFKRWH